MGQTQRRLSFALIGWIWLAGWSSTAAAIPDASLHEAVQSLDGDHDTAIAAVRVLQAGGEPAAQQIRDRWPTLSLRTRRRVVAALAQLAPDHEAAVQTLVAAARSSDEQLQELALAALRRAGPRGFNGLAALLADARVGDRAAVLMARAEPDLSLAFLLRTLATEGGTERPVLRSALGTAVQRSSTDAEPILSAWLQTEPTAPAVASAAMALTAVDEHHKLIASLIEYAVPKVSDFATKWRLLKSAGAAGPSELLDQWVHRQLGGPEEWMLRRAAVDAVTARGQRGDARVALDDPYPRVRARAASALAGDAESMVDRATLARRDAWPLVRAAAVSSLRRERTASPVVVAAVDDPMSVVREAAIEVLASSRREEGWDRVHWRLRSSEEWPRVTAAAIDYVVAHCRTDAVEALFRVIQRAAARSALTEDLNNAARAILALRALNTAEANTALEQVRAASGLPATLKIALEQPLPRASRCPSAGR